MCHSTPQPRPPEPPPPPGPVSCDVTPTTATLLFGDTLSITSSYSWNGLPAHQIVPQVWTPNGGSISVSNEPTNQDTNSGLAVYTAGGTAGIFDVDVANHQGQTYECGKTVIVTINAPPPPAQLCLTPNGTFVVGTNASFSITPLATKTFMFLAPTTRTYTFSATVVAGSNQFEGHVNTDNVLCCAGVGPDLCNFFIPTPVVSSVLTANSWYVVCVHNKKFTNSYAVTIV